MQPNIEITRANDITIKSPNREVFKLTFKTIFDLDDQEFTILKERLSDKEEFLDSERQGVFYKNSTFNNPLTFEDMGLLKDIELFKETGESSDESQLPPYVIFHDYQKNYKENCKIVGYISFYFYDGKIEPDSIFFKGFRDRKIAIPTLSCLLADAFHEIDNQGRLNEYQELYVTVHPQNLASKRIIEKLGFTFKKMDKDEGLPHVNSEEDHVVDFLETTRHSEKSLQNFSKETEVDQKTFGEKSVKTKEDYDQKTKETKDFIPTHRASETTDETEDFIQTQDEEEFKQIFSEPIDSVIASQDLLLVEVQDNIKTEDDINKKYRLRLVATNKTELPKLFEQLANILEENTDYSEAINFLRDPKHLALTKLPLSSYQPDLETETKSPNSSCLVNKLTTSSCQTHITFSQDL